jgi:predicted nucleic acid-binding protein
VTEFARVVSHPRLFDPPTPTPEALAAIDALLASPSARLLQPGVRFLPLLAEVAREAQATGNLLYDAQIVALCIEHGARTLLSEDSDFLRFPSIRLERLP